MTHINKAKTLTTCPQCNSELNAILRLILYNVTVRDGLVIHYQGGPQPESDSDIAELCDSDNTIIVCERGHLLTTPLTDSDPITTLTRIAHWPANPNSEPDVMGEALDEITALAAAALHNLLPKQTLPFKEGHGYNSTQTGDYYIFSGLKTGLYAFYRPSTGSGHRLTSEEASICFDYKRSKNEADNEEAQEAHDWHNRNITI